MKATRCLMLAAALLILVLTACTPAVTPEQKSDPPADGAMVDVPEDVRRARDAAIRYVEGAYDLSGLNDPMDWSAADITQPNIVGQGAYQFLSGDWMVAVSYPVVAPENMLYTVEIANSALNFVWKGVVFPDGSIAEPTEDAHPDAAYLKDHSEARNAALAYVINRYVPAQDTHMVPAEISWSQKQIGNLLGYTAWLYRCDHWEVEVGAPVVALDDVAYDIRLVSLDYGFSWEGTVNATGRVVELRAPLPIANETEINVTGWLGYIESLPADAQWDDRIVFTSGAGAFGVEGATPDIQALLVELRDRKEPGKEAHFWGVLTCDVPDSGGCQLRVNRVRVGAVETPPEPVVAWHGTVVSSPPGSQFDDVFILSGDYPVGFGVGSLDSGVVEEIEALRDTGREIIVWGVLRTGVADSYGAQIEVERLAYVP